MIWTKQYSLQLSQVTELSFDPLVNRRCEQARISQQNSKLEFCTISHMEFNGVQNGEGVQIGFHGFSLYLIRIKNNKTSLFYFHKCKASANIFCFTQLLLIFAL